MIFSLIAVVITLAAHSATATPLDWAQPAGAPAHGLFRRHPSASRLLNRQAGSKSFPVLTDTAAYPIAGDVPPVSGIPKAWLDKLKSVKIADVPVATKIAENQVEYPAGINIASKEVCAFIGTACARADDIVDIPEGVLGVSLISAQLTPRSRSMTAQGKAQICSPNSWTARSSHPMLPTSSLVATSPPDPPSLTPFSTAVATLPFTPGHTSSVGTCLATLTTVTSLTNEQVVAELGWTMQIIFDKSGGRIPQFWRPPYGDVDERVRDIAKLVFGLQTVLWNADTEDWKVKGQGKTQMEATVDAWAVGAKSPGLNLLIHEIHLESVEIFKDKLAGFEKNGWKLFNIAEAVNQPMYANAPDSTGEVTKKDGILDGGAAPSIDLPAPSGPAPSVSAAAPSSAAPSTAPSPAAAEPSKSASPPQCKVVTKS